MKKNLLVLMMSLMGFVGWCDELPRVLIIGDSISIGYAPQVAVLLKDRAQVSRPGADGKPVINCGDTRRGLENVDVWLGDRSWDVIHFNWGLHDLCYRDLESKPPKLRDKKTGKLSVSPEDYRANLEKLVQRLEKTGAKLIWASTTIVPEGESGRFVGDDLKYNAIAAEIMKAHRIPINDLNALSRSFPENLFAGKGNVHYTKTGYAQLAEQVADRINQALSSTP